MSENSSPGLTAANTTPPAAAASENILGKIADQARHAGTHAAELAGEVGHDAQTRAASFAGEVADRVGTVAETGKTSFAEQLGDAAKAIHRAGEQLEGHQDWLAHLVARGADEIDALAITLRTNDMPGLLGKVNDLARRQPAVFVGAAMALGFAAVRIGKVAVAGASRADLPNMPEVPHGPR